MLYFKARYHAVKHKCSNCGNQIPETPIFGSKDPGLFWAATRISFKDHFMNVEAVVACQRCRQLDTWDWFEDPQKRSVPPDDPDGAYITALWEKKLETENSGRSVRSGGERTSELRPREESVRPPAVGGTGDVGARTSGKQGSRAFRGVAVENGG